MIGVISGAGRGGVGNNAISGQLAVIADGVSASPLPSIPRDVLEEAVPGSIRKAEHFITFLKKIVVYFKSLLTATQNVESKTPLRFLHDLQAATALERKPLRFTYSRLNSLLRTLEVTSLDEFNALTDLAHFVTLLSTYLEGFSIIADPQGSNNLGTASNNARGLYEPVIQLTCLDASIAIKVSIIC
jgi:DNA excision repair protein ERCC-2